MPFFFPQFCIEIPGDFAFGIDAGSPPLERCRDRGLHYITRNCCSCVARNTLVFELGRQRRRPEPGAPGRHFPGRFAWFGSI